MNWIKRQRAQHLLKKCFQNLMAAQTKNSRKYFAPSAEAAEKTYYRQRLSTRLSKQDFEIGPFRNPSDVRKALENYWQEDDPSLLAFAQDCERLVSFFEHDEDAPEEISPFVYVMY